VSGFTVMSGGEGIHPSLESLPSRRNNPKFGQRKGITNIERIFRKNSLTFPLD